MTGLAHRPRQRSPICPESLAGPAVSGAVGRGVQGSGGGRHRAGSPQPRMSSICLPFRPSWGPLSAVLHSDMA